MPIHSYEYSHNYDPPMPILEVQVISPETQETSNLQTALIDSGSDGTMIPLDLLDDIGAISVGQAIMSGIWGERRHVNIYLVSIRIGSHLLRGIRTAGVSDEFGFILGRNVLNQLTITLQGESLTVEIPTVNT